MDIYIKTEFSIEGLTEKEMRCIVRSLEPDNVGLPEETKIYFKDVKSGFKCIIEGSFKLGSFIRTWNDLIVSIQLLKDLIAMLRKVV